MHSVRPIDRKFNQHGILRDLRREIAVFRLYNAIFDIKYEPPVTNEKKKTEPKKNADVKFTLHLAR